MENNFRARLPPHDATIDLESFSRESDLGFIVKFKVRRRRSLNVINLTHSTEATNIFDRVKERYQAWGENFKIEIPNTFDVVLFEGQRFPCTKVIFQFEGGNKSEEEPKLQFEFLQ